MNFVITLFMLLSTIVNGQLILDDPVEYPSDFYDLYRLVETGAPGWVFDECDVYGPQLHWDSAVSLFQSTSKEFEDRAFDMLIFLALADKEYTYNICGDSNGKPILYGPGVNEFMMWYSLPERYESERLPIVAEGVVENITNVISIFIP